MNQEISRLVHMYAIRDTKSQCFNLPFGAKTHGDAERGFRTIVNSNNPNQLVSVYPEDYDLYYLGTYDEISGKFAPMDTPQHIVKGIQLKEQKPISQ